MFGRTLTALGVLLAAQLVSGCCWCHRPFLCCRHRYFAPYDSCTTCYQPGGAVGIPAYAGVATAPIPYVKSATGGTSVPIPTGPQPTTAPMGTIPSFPAASATFTNGPIPTFTNGPIR
jgi:hypothetical protein